MGATLTEPTRRLSPRPAYLKRSLDLTPDLDEALREVAYNRRRSVAEVIREAISFYLQSGAGDGQADADAGAPMAGEVQTLVQKTAVLEAQLAALPKQLAEMAAKAVREAVLERHAESSADRIIAEMTEGEQAELLERLARKIEERHKK